MQPAQIEVEKAKVTHDAAYRGTRRIQGFTAVVEAAKADFNRIQEDVKKAEANLTLAKKQRAEVTDKLSIVAKA